MDNKRSVGVKFFAYAFLIIGGVATYRQASGNIGYYQAFLNINFAYFLCVVRDIGFISKKLVTLSSNSIISGKHL